MRHYSTFSQDFTRRSEESDEDSRISSYLRTREQIEALAEEIEFLSKLPDEDQAKLAKLRRLLAKARGEPVEEQPEKATETPAAKDDPSVDELLADLDLEAADGGETDLIETLTAADEDAVTTPPKEQRTIRDFIQAPPPAPERPTEREIALKRIRELEARQSRPAMADLSPDQFERANRFACGDREEISTGYQRHKTVDSDPFGVDEMLAGLDHDGETDDDTSAPPEPETASTDDTTESGRIKSPTLTAADEEPVTARKSRSDDDNPPAPRDPAPLTVDELIADLDMDGPVEDQEQRIARRRAAGAERARRHRAAKAKAAPITLYDEPIVRREQKYDFHLRKNVLEAFTARRGNKIAERLRGRESLIAMVWLVRRNNPGASDKRIAMLAGYDLTKRRVRGHRSIIAKLEAVGGPWHGLQ